MVAPVFVTQAKASATFATCAADRAEANVAETLVYSACTGLLYLICKGFIRAWDHDLVLQSHPVIPFVCVLGGVPH